MKNVMYFFLLSTLVFVTSSCHKCFDRNNDDCPDNLFCTEIFVSLSVLFELQDVNINEVSHSETTLKSTGKKIFEHNYQLPFDMGPYYGIILDDSVLKQINKTGNVVVFTLYSTTGEVITREEFTVGHDCCHVIKLNGKDKIIL